MSGILTPIAGEAKKRTCYFFDSGECSPSLCDVATASWCRTEAPPTDAVEFTSALPGER